jgi:glycosyltransferase involved in cell wall biosynthesis
VRKFFLINAGATIFMHSAAKDNLPLVSVIIPAYNAAQFIEKTLNSVLAQTYKNFEVLVVDDGSQDCTAEIVKSIAALDARVILLQQPNSGVAAARNLGIQKSQGEFIAPLDADDIWYTQNLEKQVQCFLQSDASVGLVYAWSVDINQANLQSGEVRASRIEGEVYTTLLCHDFIANASSVLIRRACLDKAGGYNSQLQAQNGQGGEDWDLYLRIAQFYQFRVVPEFLVGYRKLPDSMSSNYDSMAKSRELIWQSIRQKYPNIPDIIYRLSTSSFYMYLARQSNLYGRHKITLFWLCNALRREWVTPFLRLGFYILLVKSLLGLMAEAIIGQKSEEKVKCEQKYSSKDLGAIAKFNLKLLAETLLHSLVPILFGTPKTWSKVLPSEKCSSTPQL